MEYAQWEPDAANGEDNVTFHNAKNEGPSSNSSFDFISTFDCIHDITYPTEMIPAIRKVLKPA